MNMYREAESFVLFCLFSTADEYSYFSNRLWRNAHLALETLRYRGKITKTCGHGMYLMTRQTNINDSGSLRLQPPLRHRDFNQSPRYRDVNRDAPHKRPNVITTPFIIN